MNTITTFDHSPSPNHSISSGRNTSRGVALNAVMNGSSIALSVRERPISTPSGSPTTIASPSPSAKPEALTPSGAQIVPVANIAHSVPAIWLGVVKNSLVPADSVTKCGSSSHTQQQRDDAADAEDGRLEAPPQALRRRARGHRRRDIGA